MSPAATVPLSEARSPPRSRLLWAAGGHAVPIDKIVARHVRSMANLSAAIQLSDRVYAYDNSVEDVEARLCVRPQDGFLWKIYGPLPQWVADATADLARHPEFVDVRHAG